MVDSPVETDIRLAIFELQRYLSDQVAPLLVAESMDLLLGCPPELVATEIRRWVAVQYRRSEGAASISDYLFHALKKIHMLSEFDLVDREPLSRFMEHLVQLLMGACPDEEREGLVASLHSLGKSSATVAPVEILHRRMGSRAAAAPPADSIAHSSAGATATDLRRIALLLGRLSEESPRRAGGVGLPPKQPRGEVLSGLLTAAVSGVQTTDDLDAIVKRIGELGLDTRTEEMFRILGRSVPGWAVAAGTWDGAIAEQLQSSRPLEAMRRLLSAAQDPGEGARRFNEMVQAAIEQFNEGSLVQAAAMLDLAERFTAEKRLNTEVTGSIRRRAQETLSPERLRMLAERPETHISLRKVLNFFAALTPQGLLNGLFEGEPRRERRKLMLALLEAHGDAARSAALEELGRCLREGVPDPKGFYFRNLVFILRRLPRPHEVSVEAELDLLIPLSGPGSPVLVAKEAIWTLGRISHPRAEQTLVSRLQEIESLLQNGSGGAKGSEGLQELLDKTVLALAGYGSQSAARFVVNHALKKQPALGDTMARLGGLAGRDLSSDKDLVSALVGHIRNALPQRVLGLVVQKEDKDLLHLIRAVSGTTAPSVRQLLEEIVQRFPSEDFAKAAFEALDALGATMRPAEGPAKVLSGDLELFSLPSLLQALADSQMTGTLTLSDAESRTVATMVFEGGRVLRCETEALHGESAFYQLFERPVGGGFVFRSLSTGVAKSRSFPADGPEDPPIDVLPAVLEALRRYDEFQQARALVPDDMELKPTGTKPTRPADERDTVLLRELWTKLSTGASAAACEAAVRTDSYRVRRLLAHWLEQGALQPATVA